MVETQNQYGQFCNFLLDTSLTQSDKEGLSSMLGTNPYNVSSTMIPAIVQTVIHTGGGTVNAVAAVPVNSVTTQVAGDRSGLVVVAVAAAAGIGTAIPYTFCLPLLSGIVGVNASKMLPIGKLNAPLRLELFL